MVLSSENIQLIEKFNDATRRGFFIDGKLVTRVHNEVFGRNLKPTSCMTCVKNRVKDLVNALNQFKEELAKQEEEKATEAKETPLDEPIAPKKRGGRPRKTTE